MGFPETQKAMLIAAIVAVSMPTMTAKAQSQQSPEEFYRGSTIRLQVGSAPGGGYDTVGRLVAQHIGKYIPGNPNIIVENVGGAGSLPLANEFLNITPRDGSVFGVMNSGMPTTPLLMPEAVHFDARDFNFIGSPAKEYQVLLVWHTAPAETLEDVFNTEIIVGAGGPGAATLDFPLLTNALLGTQFRIVQGYPGTAEIHMAMERGEVEANAALLWTSLKQQYPNELEDGTLRVLAQYGFAPHPELEDVPMFPVGDTEEERQIFELMFARQDYGRVFVTPPGVPEERLAVLRSAFEATMEDPDFLQEAERLAVEINPVPWAELEALTDRLYEMEPEVLERVRELLNQGS